MRPGPLSRGDLVVGEELSPAYLVLCAGCQRDFLIDQDLSDPKRLFDPPAWFCRSCRGETS